jgi:catechol 2,3-dioxygenase-like lactoylglutathione lyase family enzyme
MNETRKESSPVSHEGPAPIGETESFVLAFHGVRYQVKDVSRSVAFYTKQLGFKLEMQQLPAFASVSIGNLKIMLSGPGASGSRPMPNGRHQEPGGWNRVVLQVADLSGDVRLIPINRVAAAVGEGSMAIAFVHQFLAREGLRTER